MVVADAGGEFVAVPAHVGAQAAGGGEAAPPRAHGGGADHGVVRVEEAEDTVEKMVRDVVHRSRCHRRRRRSASCAATRSL